ncbi:TPA: alkene reductase, partial [Klebsiella pneumoniae]
ENRQRFLLETIDAVAEAVGNSHVAVRLSPFGRIYDLAPYEGEDQTWSAITDALGQRELAYVHLYYQPVYTKAPLPEGFRRRFRNTFKGTIIAAGGFTRDIAEQALEDDELDLVAFGVPYIANPDLVERMQNGWPLAESDRATYYGVSGSPEKGYTDYPVWQAQ